MTQNKEVGSRIGPNLAMAGNAVGLGNFLRFPVQAVQNGGVLGHSVINLLLLMGFHSCMSSGLWPICGKMSIIPHHLFYVLWMPQNFEVHGCLLFLQILVVVAAYYC
ncbi:MAG: hypothetical protein IPP29_13295 [Bacteroidetes bacterium]|nr:hypothetical protein [Bacteroidota bacterium]